MAEKFSKAAAGTFTLNKDEPIHRWYSYLEGYSSCLIDDLFQNIGVDQIHAVYDPFCGTGTTSLVAAKYGIPSYYSEINPFMCQVIEAKVNCVKRLRDTGLRSFYLRAHKRMVENFPYQITLTPVTWDGFEKFFDEQVLNILQQLMASVAEIPDKDSRTIAEVALASVTVQASKMIRQGDLRAAKVGEKKASDRDLIRNYLTKLDLVISDLDNLDIPVRTETVCLSPDARDITEENLVDCIITSPPYLNGTNYIRNTKLELKLCGYVQTEKDLPLLHSQGIIAGINNVSGRRPITQGNKYVQPFLNALEPVTYDRRIPQMVAGYFNDMENVIERLTHILKNRGIFIMDIGDSQFAGVHIPTHELLTRICQDHGFKLTDEEILRERRSKNGMVLSQRLLKFQLKKADDPKHSYKTESKHFIDTLPYREVPYNSRNWGHPWHSLCSYHGKLKPAIAHFLVSEFTRPGDVVLDPLCGVGTIPFEACSQGRIGIGNDLSTLAYVVTKAKLEKPSTKDCIAVVNDLEKYIKNSKNCVWITKDAQKYNDFGFNGKLPSYFEEETFREILCARRYFMKHLPKLTDAEAMVFSCLLHVLHGNRPYALSRTSHPLTPYAPTGEFQYKDTIQHIKDKLDLTFAKGDFTHYLPGKAIHGDYQELTNYKIQADVIISSPPFANSLRFYMQNWLRLWLCGWEEDDFKTADTAFLDRRQRKSFDVYKPFFETCSTVLKPHGKVILHLGQTEKIDMAEELAARAEPYFDEVYRGTENVQTIEKHGIRDKGGTIAHQFLFLIKK